MQIKVKDKFFVPYLSKEQIEKSVNAIAIQINQDYKDEEVIFIGVLNGVFMFASDLLKNIKLDCKICFTKVSSYQGTQSTGKVKNLIGINEDLKGKNVIILEDIVDTGLTMRHVRKQILDLEPKSLEIAALIFKPESFKEEYNVKYRGFDTPNDFIVGYGLDYDGYAREYPDIYILKND